MRHCWLVPTCIDSDPLEVCCFKLLPRSQFIAWFDMPIIKRLTLNHSTVTPGTRLNWHIGCSFAVIDTVCHNSGNHQFLYLRGPNTYLIPTSQVDLAPSPPRTQPPHRSTHNLNNSDSPQHPPTSQQLKHPSSSAHAPPLPSRLSSTHMPTLNTNSSNLNPRPKSRSGSEEVAAAVADLDPSIAWISDWRLQLALSGSEFGSCKDLLMQLSLLAAACYSRAARPRNAMLLYGDVAQVCAAAGRHEGAVLLLGVALHRATEEGW